MVFSPELGSVRAVEVPLTDRFMAKLRENFDNLPSLSRGPQPKKSQQSDQIFQDNDQSARTFTQNVWPWTISTCN
jgi:hypothetical protein